MKRIIGTHIQFLSFGIIKPPDKGDELGKEKDEFLLPERTWTLRARPGESQAKEARVSRSSFLLTHGINLPGNLWELFLDARLDGEFRKAWICQDSINTFATAALIRP
jgi:hypothetical protein